MIATRDGYSETLKMIKQMHTVEYVTKDDYIAVLQSHQIYLDKIWSDQRDKAAAADDSYKYIE